MIVNDKFGYITNASRDDLLDLIHNGQVVHFCYWPKPEHWALCNFKIRSFVTRNKDLVTCDACMRRLKAKLLSLPKVKQ